MSFKLYPVTKTEVSTKDYEVKINGEVVELDTARVSARPFNRRWPGHQRELDQTELGNFLSLSSDEPLNFEVKPKKPFEKVIIRPLSLGIVPDIDPDGTIRFTLPKSAYFTLEPFGRNNALHVFVDPIKKYDIEFLNINENKININLNCIISIKMVNIINMLHYLKKKGGKYNGKSSDRRSYAYSNE